MEGLELASNIKYYLDYSKWKDDLDRYENWSDSVNRIMEMNKTHLGDRYFLIKDEFEFARKKYEEQFVLGSQRCLQFGGEPILKKNCKIYNCATTYIDRIRVFQEIFWVLLCGSGVGYSVQTHHVSKLPNLNKRSDKSIVLTIEDSIEGWSDALGALIDSYINKDSKFFGYNIKFDYSLIREEGSFISGGFKAPGHHGLKTSLEKIEDIIENHLKISSIITPFLAHRIICITADAVLSGGVRRSALIALFSKDDEEMLKCKTGNWYSEMRELGRANNSVVLLKQKLTEEELQSYVEYIRQFGEPGIYLAYDTEILYNPCFEISMYPVDEITGESGWQFCNLVTINAKKCKSISQFYDACVASATLGTIQASYDKFDYLGEVTERIVKREALLGCSITGVMNNTLIHNKEVLNIGVSLIRETNKDIAEKIGINPAARLTCIKPEGNSSVILKCRSGITPEHSPYYFRLMQVNKNSEINKFLEKEIPCILEESVWSRDNSDNVVYVPVVSDKESLYKKDVYDEKHLEIIKLFQKEWVLYGTNSELCVNKNANHNVSNTVEVRNWNNVVKYIYENKEYFTGISLLSFIGDKQYNQAPFTSVLNLNELIEEYGDSVLFASGLIVDGLHRFSNLYDACEYVIKPELKLTGNSDDILLKVDWIRRVKKFSKNYFKGDLTKTVYCLRDVNMFHKWKLITKELSKKKLDISSNLTKPEYKNANELAAASCFGGSCEI